MITLTPEAALHIKKMLESKPGGIGLRLGTKASGCSGYAYIVDFAETINDNDILVKSEGITLVVDDDSVPMLKGMTIDYVSTNAINKGFDFINPNAKASCGCGESITF